MIYNNLLFKHLSGKEFYLITFGVFALICFTVNNVQSQNYAWAHGIGGTSADIGRSIAVDANGNVYVTGSFQGSNVDFDPGTGAANLTSGGSSDIYLAKYDANGNYQWAHSIGGADGQFGMSIAVDASGNIYITGIFRGTNIDFDPGAGTANLTSAGNNDIFFAKYDTNGNYQWVHRIGGTSTDSGSSITLDTSGNIYLTGSFNATVDFNPGAGVANLTTGTGTGATFFAKYDSNGTYLWARQVLNGAGNSIAVDSNGNVYITGSFRGSNIDFDPGAGTAYLTSVGNSDIFLAKYDSNGDYQWAYSFGATDFEFGNSVIVDGNGNVYTTGYFSDTIDFNPGAGTANLTSNGASDIYLAKYDTNGNYQWAHNIGGSGFDKGNAITMDSSGDIYITGSFEQTVDFDTGTGTVNLTSAGDEDVFVAKYDTNGNYQWALKAGSTSSSAESGNAIVLDNNKNVYITGSFRETADFDPGTGTSNLTSNGDTDFFFAKYFEPVPEINLKTTTANIASGGTYDFGNQILGSSSSNQTFTIENLGTADLTLTGTAGSVVELNGTDASAFTITQASVTSPIASGANKTFEVKFTPSKVGSHSATLTIKNNDADEGTYTINLTGTGQGVPEINVQQNNVDIASGGEINLGTINVNSLSNIVTFTIQNTGSAVLTLSGSIGSIVNLSGSNASDFAVTQTSIISSIDAGSSQDFTVSFTPSGTGIRTATLTINSNDSDESAYTINLKGTGQANVPEINIQQNNRDIASGSSVDLGSVNINTTSNNYTFLIQNQGANDLQLTGAAGNILVLSGTNASDFTVNQTNVTSSIAANKTQSFTVSFTPSSLGERTATLTISSNDSDEGTYTINLKGIGQGVPEINVQQNSNDVASGSTIDLGSVEVGRDSAPFTFTIQNTGTGDLELGGLNLKVKISGPNASNFRVDQTNITSTISAGNSQSFTVTFKPFVEGERTATLTISNNDSDEGTYTLNLKGIGGNSITALPKLTKFDMLAYPNPAINTLVLASEQWQGQALKVQVVNSQGQVILKRDFAQAQNRIKLDVSSFPLSLYYVTLEWAGTKVLHRFIKK